MFSYYGGKSKIIHHYPLPEFNTIIEPFAGSARYCLRFYDKDCWINDSYEVIYEIWNWLINESTCDELLENKDYCAGEDIRNRNLKKGFRYLLGFLINRGSSSPANFVTNWSCQVKNRPNWASTVSFNIINCAKSLQKIKHWKVSCLNYLDLPNIEATWFIDPPYQNGGKYYVKNEIDYKQLADWCKTRKGQVIVCENSKADWLPFRPLKEMSGQRYKTLEMIWTNGKEQ